MTPEERRAYHRSWRQRHPGYYAAYMRRWVAANRDRVRAYQEGANERRALKPCLEDGCELPRYLSPRGVAATRCQPHLLERWAEKARRRDAARRGRDRSRKPYVPRFVPPAERPCLGEPEVADPARCDNPRLVDDLGRVYNRCAEHYNPRQHPKYPEPAPLQYRSKPAPKPRRDPRYNTARWHRLRARVLGIPAGRRSPTALCWWPDVDPHPAEVADHIVAVYPGMPDAEFYGRHNVRPSCQHHNKARGFLAAGAAARADALDDRPTRTASIFARRRPR